MPFQPDSSGKSVASQTALFMYLECVSSWAFPETRLHCVSRISNCPLFARKANIHTSMGQGWPNGSRVTELCAAMNPNAFWAWAVFPFETSAFVDLRFGPH